MSGLIASAVRECLTDTRILVQIAVLVGALSVASTSRAIAIVDMDFNGVTGLENAGIGPDGVLRGGASIANGQLVLIGSNAAEPTGAGLDLDIGQFGTFSGSEDFLVEFDFASIDGGSGALFAADGAKFQFDSGGEIPGGQAGSLNVYSVGDAVVADLWFIGAVEVEGAFDDDLPHHVSVFYDASDARLELSVDDVEGDPLIVEDGDGFLRDTSHDITRLGDENNPDFGSEFNSGCRCSFDNLLIEGPTPPPVKLIVNRLTGALTLEAISAEPVNINFLSIVSDAGTLDPANYAEIDAGNPTFDPDDVWQIDLANNTEISQSDAAGGANNGATLTSGQTFTLGNDVWRPFFDEDLDVFVFDTALGGEVRGTVEYTGGSTALFGDLDLDGDIDVQDYVVFDNGFDEDVDGLSRFDAYFLGDLNGDETHNFEDFISFAEAFDAANGAGAFAIMSATVPEPGTCLLALLAMAMIMISAHRVRYSPGPCFKGSVVAFVCLLSAQTASAVELVEYLFDANFNDTSGNNRHGIPNTGVFGGPPTVSGGRLNLTGDLEEGLIVPLAAANPFHGLSDYTVEMSIASMGSTAFPEAGAILLGSANMNEPAEPDNQSFAVFVEPQADGGSLVVDYFFLGEVRVPDAMLLDGMEHSIKITYLAPDEPGPEDDPNPGTMYLNIDGEWLTDDDVTPRVPNIANHQVRIGGSLNTDFPYECVEGDCFTSELQGTVDNFRILNDPMAPTLLRAEVDLATGEITLLGGEFHRDIRYYEINSQGGALNPAGWNSLQDQNLDAEGMGVGQHWDELAALPSQLAESFLLGSSSFDEDREISLGNAFQSGGARDLDINVVTEDLLNLSVEVLYVNAPAAVAGDYNENGVVDAADYVVWRDRMGPGSLPNEGGISPGMIDAADYNFWRSRFGSTSGSGSGAALGATVPEPGTWALMLVAGCGWYFRHPRQCC